MLQPRVSEVAQPARDIDGPPSFRWQPAKGPRVGARCGRLKRRVLASLTGKRNESCQPHRRRVPRRSSPDWSVAILGTQRAPRPSLQSHHEFIACPSLPHNAEKGYQRGTRATLGVSRLWVAVKSGGHLAGPRQRGDRRRQHQKNQSMSRSSEAHQFRPNMAPRQACNGRIACPQSSPRHWAADRRPHQFCLRIGSPARSLGFGGPSRSGLHHAVRRHTGVATPRCSPSPVSTDLSTAEAVHALDHSKPSTPASVRSVVVLAAPVGLSCGVALEGE